MVLGGSNGVGLICSKGGFVSGSFGSDLDGSICFYGGFHTTDLFCFYGGIHTTGSLFLVLDLSLRWFGCEVVGGNGEWIWWSGGGFVVAHRGSGGGGCFRCRHGLCEQMRSLGLLVVVVRFWRRRRFVFFFVVLCSSSWW
jgi:hypothetical protein